MARCDVCGTHVDMPYNCRGCGGTHCSAHRLPENHSCPGLDQWNDPGGVFDSGFDASVDTTSTTEPSLPDRLFAPGGLLGYFRGNVSYLFLAIMFVVFVVQFAVYPLVLGADTDSALWRQTFVLTSANPLFVWTWVTSVFSHANIAHIFGNGIVLFFFGPVLERRIGTRRFTAMFLLSGMAAGLAQIAFGVAIGDPVPGVLGASGAILAILGMLTVLNPDLKVYLYFILPIPIWVLTFGYAGLSVLGVVAPGIGRGIAHFAHLTGLVLGLAYAQHLKGQISAPREIRLGGGGGRRPGGPGGPGGRL